MIKMVRKDVIESMNEIKDKEFNLIIVDPPYKKGFTKYFYIFKNKLKPNGQILWFCQPMEIFDLPEKPMQILVWKEPYSPKPIKRKYREFFDVIAWYAYGEYTFNKLLWNLMSGVFEDTVIGYTRRHKWEKPRTLIERLILVHTNEGDTVFDPFAGSGIVGEVCAKLKRNYIGYEIKKKK